MGRLDWLRGKTTPRENAQSIGRARTHRRSIGRAARDSERWEDRDRRRFGN